VAVWELHRLGWWYEKPRRAAKLAPDAAECISHLCSWSKSSPPIGLGISKNTVFVLLFHPAPLRTYCVAGRPSVESTGHTWHDVFRTGGRSGREQDPGWAFPTAAAMTHNRFVGTSWQLFLESSNMCVCCSPRETIKTNLFALGGFCLYFTNSLMVSSVMPRDALVWYPGSEWTGSLQLSTYIRPRDSIRRKKNLGTGGANSPCGKLSEPHLLNARKAYYHPHIHRATLLSPS